MKVLISVESKHGSTEEIAAAIAAELIAVGLDVDALDPAEVESVSEYDAVVLGSAIYMGNLMPGVMKFVERHDRALRSRDVWLFSSGPLGDPPGPAEPPADGVLLERTGAREHRVFAGKLKKEELALGEKLIVNIARAPFGDFRDWEAIRAWARGIGAALKQKVAA